MRRRASRRAIALSILRDHRGCTATIFALHFWGEADRAWQAGAYLGRLVRDGLVRRSASEPPRFRLTRAGRVETTQGLA